METTFSLTTQFFIQLSLGILAGFVCARHARQQGRNPRSWFLLGILFGIFAFLYLVFTRKKVRQRQEMIKPAPQPVIFKKSEPTVLWYYLDHAQATQGPMSQYALKKALEDKKISPQTYVWNETLSDWKRFEETVTS